MSLRGDGVAAPDDDEIDDGNPADHNDRERQDGGDEKQLRPRGCFLGCVHRRHLDGGSAFDRDRHGLDDFALLVLARCNRRNRQDEAGKQGCGRYTV